MDIAIVSGASSGLGLAISRKLIDLGYRVYGLGGNYSDTPLNHPSFVPVPVNLTDLQAVKDKVEEIIEKEGNIYILVNNAKIYPSKNLDETPFTEVETVLKINLHLPVLLTQLALPGLRKYQGFIINVGSASPELSRGGPVGAMTSGGLNFFGQSMFETYRQNGVKVTSIYPQANRWRPEEVPPPADDNPTCVIDAQAIADAVGDIVTSKSGNIITELVIRPKTVVEDTRSPVYYVPYPKPKPLPNVGLRSSSPAQSEFRPRKSASTTTKKIIKRSEQIEEDVAEREVSETEDNSEGKELSRSARRRRHQKERRQQKQEKHEATEIKKKEPVEEINEQQDDPISKQQATESEVFVEPAVAEESKPIKKSRRNRQRSAFGHMKPGSSSTDKNDKVPGLINDGGSVGESGFQSRFAQDSTEEGSQRRRRGRGIRIGNKKKEAAPESTPVNDDMLPGELPEAPAKSPAKKVKKVEKAVKKVAVKKAAKKVTKKAVKKVAVKKSVKKTATKKVAKKVEAEKVEKAVPVKKIPAKKTATKKATKKVATKKAVKKAVAKKAVKKVATKKVAKKKTAKKASE